MEAIAAAHGKPPEDQALGVAATCSDARAALPAAPAAALDRGGAQLCNTGSSKSVGMEASHGSGAAEVLLRRLEVAMDLDQGHLEKIERHLLTVTEP